VGLKKGELGTEKGGKGVDAWKAAWWGEKLETTGFERGSGQKSCTYWNKGFWRGRETQSSRRKERE